MVEIIEEDYTADFTGPSPRARKLAEDSDFSAEDWQTGIDTIGEKWTIHAHTVASGLGKEFLKVIEAYREIMGKDNG